MLRGPGLRRSSHSIARRFRHQTALHQMPHPEVHRAASIAGPAPSSECRAAPFFFLTDFVRASTPFLEDGLRPPTPTTGHVPAGKCRGARSAWASTFAENSMRRNFRVRVAECVVGWAFPNQAADDGDPGDLSSSFR